MKMRIKDRDRDEKQGQDYIWKPVGTRKRITDKDKVEKPGTVAENQFE
jgi:hypothetical protein